MEGADRAATEALARKLEADAMLRRKGVIDPRTDAYAAAQAVLLAERDAEGKIVGGHVADFHAAILAKGGTAKYAALVRARIVAVLDKAGAKRISELTPSRVQAAIGALRDSGLSLATCNHHLGAVKELGRWLWRDGRAREHGLAHMTAFNTATDRRHDRRELSDEELTALIVAAQAGRRFGNMEGADRATLYRVALGTGFRAGELGSLTPQAFALDATPPTITVEASASKHRRTDVQEIRPELADLLRPFMAGRPAGVPAFAVPTKTVRMIRHDLDAARAAWLDESRTEAERQDRERSYFLSYEDAAGRFADFHSLRHCFVSRLVRSGASIKTAQTLARHSTPALTVGRYSHVALADTRKALEAVPVFAPENPQAAAKMTGTDGRTVDVQAAPDATGGPRIADRGPVGPDGRPRGGSGTASRVAPALARRRAFVRFGANTGDNGENGQGAESLGNTRETLDSTGDSCIPRKWRRRESNPRPVTFQRRPLRA